MTKQTPRIVIIGAGFAGLSAAQTLAKADAEIILIDRNNHHAFQPLLYQVATAALSPAQIAQPIRTIVKKQKNCTVIQGEIIGIDKEKRIVHGHKGSLEYDYLVIATGAKHTYFGHDEWALFAPGLKTIADALNIRSRILDAFEKAEASKNLEERAALMSFVIVGGGPTGVEMAGSIAELAHHTLIDEFRIIDPADAKVILVEAGDRILANFPEKLSSRAASDLSKLNVQIMTKTVVTDCRADGVQVGDQFIPARTTLWCAGVKASAAANWLGAKSDKAGRVMVQNDLSLPDFPDIFVIGDTAHVVDGNGTSVPGLAPAATQQGRHVGKIISARILGERSDAIFYYKDYGIMATIGRNKAITKIKNITFGGIVAWFLWGTIHIMPLVGFRNRVMVAIDWTLSYFSRSRGVRLINSSHDTPGI